MRCIHNTSLDPYFNLAAEEYLLRNTKHDCFMLWRNAPAVIVGKNQNAHAEINEEYVRENDIVVVRRLTGGGAVFHDLGNINFTFISCGATHREIDFKRFTSPIIEALQEMGVNAAFQGRNDLVIDGMKFSGNAQHIEKDRVLHHGTLLYASEMADLTRALKVNPLKFQDKAVKSVRKRVTNISTHLSEQVSVTEFIELLMTRIEGAATETFRSGLADEEQAAISTLAKEKYASWDWNFGYSPKYSFSRSFRTTGGTVEVHLDVREGRIEAARIFGDFFGIRPVADIETALRGVRHEREEIAGVLAGFNLTEYMAGIGIEELTENMS
jgi:lipoate-protein ligase A